MANPQNEIVTMLMEERPGLATDLYNATYGPDLPEHSCLTISRRTLRTPGQADEHRLCALATYSLLAEPVFGVLFDMILGPDDSQSGSWLWFIQETQQALGCPVALVALCPDESTAKWALACSAVGDIGSYVIPLVIPPALRQR